MPNDPEKKRKILEPNIQVMGKVAISLVRLETLDPDEVRQLVKEMTDGEHDWLDLDNRLLKPEYVSADNTYIAQPGDISVFAGHADVGEGRYPVGHQFVSQGETDQERSQRTSAIVSSVAFAKLTAEHSQR